MRNFIVALGFAILLACGASAGYAAPSDAQVRYMITNGGVDVKDNAQVKYFPAGHRDGPAVTWVGSGAVATMPAGAYDVQLTFSDGAASKEMWFENQSFSGKVERKVEIGIPMTDVRFLITNGGVDTKDSGQVHYFLAGHRDNNISWANSGEPARMAAGIYDVHVTFSDGSATKEMWLANQNLTGKVNKTVEMGMALTDVRYVITNGGVDTKDNGQVHYFLAGHRDDTIAWAHSGEATRIPAGNYDVHVTFSDGSAAKEMWISNQSFSGKVDRTIEVGVGLADVRYVITNRGVDTKDNGQVHLVPAGHHDGGVVTWTSSGGTMRIAAGAYDVHVTYMDGMINKGIWIDNQSFSGSVQKTVEMGVVPTWPTVSATEDGVDLGDKATITYFDTTEANSFGQIKSGAPALLEQGTYDIRAQFEDGEGWLRKVALTGKPHLTIAVVKPKVETLTVGAPPPKACTIEVYGVNFDFNKATLRADSDPMLKQVLALFTGTPSFSAEVSGHTDNIGTPAYNLKLSDARAASVKAWLVSHGVAPTRVSSRGYGDTKPLVPNTTDANRFKNRRVELHRQNCK